MKEAEPLHSTVHLHDPILIFFAAARDRDELEDRVVSFRMLAGAMAFRNFHEHRISSDSSYPFCRCTYTLALFDGNDFAARYRSIEDRGPAVLITHPRESILATGPSHAVTGADEVRVRVWSASPVHKVEYRVNQESWTAMDDDGPGCWRAPLPAYRLAKGTHQLIVRALAEEPGEHVIDFAVDPSGRYTAVPMVRPMVTATQFC